MNKMNNKKILLIEDDRAQADSISNLLKQKGYSVSCAYTGKDGVKQARESKLDLIIIDLMLPDISGEEVYIRIKKKMVFKKTPVIVLSINDDADSIEELFEIGIDDYIIKPPNLPRLLDKVEKYTTKKIKRKK